MKHRPAGSDDHQNVTSLHANVYVRGSPGNYVTRSRKGRIVQCLVKNEKFSCRKELRHTMLLLARMHASALYEASEIELKL